MWIKEDTSKGFKTPPPTNNRRPPRKCAMSAPAKKVPSGLSPYCKAKHVQLIDKDPSKAISLFWLAINSGDRVDSALKDMAIVMKQLDRSDEAIEAIKSFRHLCPRESQEPLDNILLELYKTSERVEDQIKMLEIKVKGIEEGFNFCGKRVKPARSQGKKIYMTIEQEYSRLLGNLAWAYMQNNNFKSAEEHYRKALSLEPDKNKQCNLAICLMHMKRISEAKLLLHTIRAPPYENRVLVDDEPYARSLERATEMLTQLESNTSTGYPCQARGLITPGEFASQPKKVPGGSINSGDRRKPLIKNSGDNSRCAPARKLAFEEDIDCCREKSVRIGENLEKDCLNYFSTPKSKKSWADMVQEEEEQGGLWQESPLAPQTQPHKVFTNENFDSNRMIIHTFKERGRHPFNERGRFRGKSDLVSSLANFVEDETVDDYVIVKT